MEFRFDVNDLFKQNIVEINANLIPPGFCAPDRRALWDGVTKVSEVINKMGEASATAQGLTKPITTSDKLRNSEHKIYLLVDKDAKSGKGIVTGMLKVGRKGLYVFDRDGHHFQVSPPCVLDFYIHETRQRTGLGKKLFEHMLEKEEIEPVKMAIDRPSDKFLAFLNKHYNLQSPIKQMNNYVVFDGFFPEANGNVAPAPPENEDNTTPTRKQTANGLQSGFAMAYGRYGAPRPPCSMGQIIHNQSPLAQQAQEPTGTGLNIRAGAKDSQRTYLQQQQQSGGSEQTQVGQGEQVYAQNNPPQATGQLPQEQNPQFPLGYQTNNAMQTPYNQQTQYYQQMTPTQQQFAPAHPSQTASLQQPQHQISSSPQQSQYQMVSPQPQMISPQQPQMVSPQQPQQQMVSPQQQIDLGQYQTATALPQQQNVSVRMLPAQQSAFSPQQQFDPRTQYQIASPQEQAHYHHGASPQQQITPSQYQMVPSQQNITTTPSQQYQIVPSQQQFVPDQFDINQQQVAVVSNQQQIAPDQQQMFPSQQQVASTLQEFAQNQQAIDNQEQIVPSQQQVASTLQEFAQNQQAIDNQEQIVPSQQQVVPDHQQIASTQQQFASGQQQIALNQQQIVPSQQQITSGHQQIASTQQQFASGQQQIAPNQQQIVPSQQQIASGQQQIASGQQQIAPNQEQIAPSQHQIASGQQQIAPSQHQIASGQQQIVVPSQQEQMSFPQQQMVAPQQQIASGDAQFYVAQANQSEKHLAKPSNLQMTNAQVPQQMYANQPQLQSYFYTSQSPPVPSQLSTSPQSHTYNYPQSNNVQTSLQQMTSQIPHIPQNDAQNTVQMSPYQIPHTPQSETIRTQNTLQQLTNQISRSPQTETTGRRQKPKSKQEIESGNYLLKLGTKRTQNGLQDEEVRTDLRNYLMLKLRGDQIQAITSTSNHEYSGYPRQYSGAQTVSPTSQNTQVYSNHQQQVAQQPQSGQPLQQHVAQQPQGGQPLQQHVAQHPQSGHLLQQHIAQHPQSGQPLQQYMAQPQSGQVYAHPDQPSQSQQIDGNELQLTGYPSQYPPSSYQQPPADEQRPEIRPITARVKKSVQFAPSANHPYVSPAQPHQTGGDAPSGNVFVDNNIPNLASSHPQNVQYSPPTYVLPAEPIHTPRSAPLEGQPSTAFPVNQSQSHPIMSPRPPQHLNQYYNSRPEPMQSHAEGPNVKHPHPQGAFVPNESGEPGPPTKAEEEEQESEPAPPPPPPKLERPQSLSLEIADDTDGGGKVGGDVVVESKVPSSPTPTHDLENGVEKIKLAATDGGGDGAADAPVPVKNGAEARKTPSHLTEQGFFDLKFYHNKLW